MHRPRSSCFDHMQSILRARLFAYCWYRAKAERRQGERALRGRRLGPASPCEPGLTHTLSDCSEGPFRWAAFVDLSLSLPPVR